MRMRALFAAAMSTILVTGAFAHNGIAAATRDIAGRAGRLQSGYLYHYAFAMLIGIVVFATWFLFGFFQ